MHKYFLHILLAIVATYSVDNVVAQNKTKNSTSVKHTQGTVDPNEPEMVFMDGGTFMMGNDEKYNEKPAHNVTVKDFYIDKYEVTVGDFRKFIQATSYHTSAEAQGWSYVFNGTNTVNQTGVTWEYDAYGFKRKPTQENHPVIYVSYNDAVAYCKWLSSVTKKKYRLPTEAEWEYAAKGGNKYGKCNFSGSNDIDAVAWYSANSNGETHAVGQKKPNEAGLYDMSGNVSEWCADWFDEKYYSQNVSNNPQGPASGTSRVSRGGSWFLEPGFNRTSSRSGFDPGFSCDYIGFRVVRDK